MEKQQDILGYIGLGVSGIGAIASIVTGNIALASIPLTIGVGCNLFSRKQYNDALVEAYNTQEQTINNLIQNLEKNRIKVDEQLHNNQQKSANSMEDFKKSMGDSLDAQKKDFVHEIKRLDLQHQELNQLVTAIEEVENLSQNIRHEDDDSAQLHYNRGVGYERLDNKEGAVQDYSEAIKQDPHIAEAHHRRGIIYLDQGYRQKAVDDLRRAALLYFEKGDIDAYHQAREMSRNIHDLRSNSNEESTEEVVVANNLFG